MSAQGSSQATKTRHHGLRGTGPKRGVLAAAVALCCVLGIGTAVAASALTDEGTTAPSGGSEALQTAAFDADGSAASPNDADGTVQPLAADTPAVIDDEARTSTEIVMNFTDEENLTPTLHLDLYEGVSVTVAWGDGNSQTASYTEGEEHSPTLGDSSDPSLYKVDVTKTEAYASTGTYTISITAKHEGEGPAYLLGQGIRGQEGYGTWYVGLLNQGQPLDADGNKQGDPEEVYGHYLVSVTTADNAGLQEDSFFGAQTRVENNDYDLFKEADFSHCDTSLVCDMEYAFANCFSLQTINVSGFDTSNVKEMKHMFANCAALTELDLTNWNTSQVTTMHEMCYGCSNLASFTLGDDWDTGEVVNMHDMFNGCSSLMALDVKDWDTSNVTDMSYMFDGCNNSNLTIPDVSKWDVSSVEDMQYMFHSCSRQAAPDVSNWNTGSVTNMQYMFYNCSNSKFTTVDVSKWNVSKVTTIYGMFYSCSNLTTLDVSSWNTSNLTNMHDTFYGCSKLEKLDVSNWKTDKVTSLSNTFQKCSKLTELDVSKWDVSSISDNLAHTFDGCSSLTTLDVSKWQSPKNRSLYGTFNGCSGLTELDVSGFDTSTVTTMRETFQGCSKLKALDVSNWNTSNVTNMYLTFSGCTAITELDVSNWDTAKATDMRSMFSNCSALTELSFANWDTAKVNTSYRTNLLSGDTALRKVTLGKNFELKASDLPTPDFKEPYAASGKWQKYDEATDTFGEPMGTADISKEREAAEETWYASMATLQQEWFTVNSPVDCTGSPIDPTITITDTGTALGVTDTDYTVSYQDENGNPVESIVNPGTYKVVLTGTGELLGDSPHGNYTGSVSYEFVVNDVPISTEIVMNFTDAGANLTPTLHLDLYEGAEVTVDWGDGSESQTASYEEGYKHAPNLGDEDDPNLYAVDFTKDTAYENPTNPDSDDGTYTITISAGAGMSPAYLLGQGINGQEGFDTDYIALLNQGKPLDENGDPQENPDEVYGHYLVSVKTAANAGIQEDSFFGAQTKVEDNDYDLFTTADFSECDTSLVRDMEYAFANCFSLETIDVSGFDTSNVVEMKHMFQNCAALTELDLSNWNTSTVTTMHYLCDGCSSLTSFTFGKGWDTSQVTEMQDMFNNCKALTAIDVSDWDTSQVTNMSYMFASCESLEELDVSAWDTSQVTGLSYTFAFCELLTELDVSKWNTSSNTSLDNTFNGCKALTRIDVSGWDTSQVTNIQYTFSYCESLTELDLSTWDTSSNKSLGYAFRGCTALEELNLSGWDTGNVPIGSRANVFNGDTKLRKITLGENFRLRTVDLPTPDFDSPYKATGMWQKLIDETTKTFGEPMAPGDISKERETDEEVWYASMAVLEEEWFTVDTPVDATGSPITPEITITEEGTTLGVTDTDYTVSYYDSEGNKIDSIVSGGTYYVVLTGIGDLLEGKGNYTGSVSYELEVVEEMLDTQIVMNFSKAPDEERTPTLHLDLYEGAEVTVNWGDGSGEQTASYTEGNEHAPNLGDETDADLYAVDITKEQPYASEVNPDPDEDTYTITVSAPKRFSPAYLLGQGIGEQAGYDTWYVGLLNQGQPLDKDGNKQGDPEEVYGHYLVSVKTAANAGIQADSFYGAKSGDYEKFTTADFSNCDTSLVCDFEYMFVNCDALTTIDVSGFDTSQVKEMKHMFQNCAALTELDLSNWNTSTVTTMHYLCDGCSALTSVTFGEGWDTSQVEEMHYMFNNCSALEKLETSDWNTAAVTDMNHMFYGCTEITELDMSCWDTSSVTDMKYMFYGCSKLTTLETSSWVNESVTDMEYMFFGCSALTTLGQNDASGWKNGSVTSMYNMFYDCSSLSKLDVSDWDTSSVTDIGGMFYKCSSLSGLGEGDVSLWDVSSVTNLAATFFNCSSLSELDVSDWETSSFISVDNAFSGCSSLIKLDVSSWNTELLQSMLHVFLNCSSLTELSFSSWDTKLMTNPSDDRDMFLYGDTKLRKVTLGENFELFEDDLPEPAFDDPYKATGKWRQYDEATNTFGEPMDTSVISKERESAEEVWYAAMPELEQSWFEVATPIHRTGEPIEPTITITEAGVTPDDYTISYKDADGNPIDADQVVEAGTYTVILTGTGDLLEGKGNYTGSVSYTFEVTTKSLEENVTFTLDPDSAVYDGTDQKPTVTGVDDEGEELIEGTDFTVTFKDSDGKEVEELIDAGTYTVVITADGPYYFGEVETEFVVSPRVLELEWTELNHEDLHHSSRDPRLSFTYDGVESDVTVASVTNIVDGDEFECYFDIEGGKNTDTGYYTAEIVEAHLSNHNYTIEGSLTRTCTYYIEHCELHKSMFDYDETVPYVEGGYVIDDLFSVSADAHPAPTAADYTVTCTDEADNVVEGPLTELGTYEITITALNDSNFTKSVTLEVTIVQADPEPEHNPGDPDDPAAGSLTATYGDKLASVDLTPFDDSNGSWNWDDVEGVEPTDVFVGEVGERTFTATYTPNDPHNYKTVETVVTVTVEPMPIEGMTFTFNEDEEPYTGSVITKTITAPNDPMTGEPMIEGTDYTVTYYKYDEETGDWTEQPEGPLGVGHYAFVINAVEGGNYTGTNSSESYVFDIVKATPTDEAPTGLTAVYGDTLASVILPHSDDSSDAWGWAWDNVEGQNPSEVLVGGVGEQEFSATFTPGDDTDYETRTEVLTVTVVPRPVSLVWTETAHLDGATWPETDFLWTYDGVKADLSATVTNLVDDDTCTVSSYSDNEEKNVGVHHATALELDDNNYTLTDAVNKECSYTIEHATAFVEADAASKTYGGDDPDFTYTVEGFVESDLSKITVGCSRDAAADPDAENVGVHKGVITVDVFADEGVLDNYTLLTRSGDLTIVAASIEHMNWAINVDDETYTGSAITKEIGAPKDLVHTDTPLAEDSDFTVSYRDADGNSIDASDVVDVGTYFIVITGQGNYTGTYVVHFQIVPAEVTITCDTAGKVYGAADPELTGTVKGLVNDSDLGQISYSRVEGEDVGTYTITAAYTPNANYTVTVVEADFTISSKDADSSDVTFTLEEGSFIYNGNEIRPSVTGHDGDKELVPGVDFTYTYSDNINAGENTASVIIKGQGNYGGETTITFTIEKAAVIITCEDAGKVYGENDPELTGSVEGVVEDDDLKVTYSRVEGEGVGEYTITAKYDEENTNYTVTVVEGIFTIHPKDADSSDVTFTLEEGPFTYNGSEICPSVTGYDGETPLSEEVDYTVVYSDNVNAGTATVTITGQGNYSGEVAITFTIEKATVVLGWTSNIDGAPDSFSRDYDGTELVVTPYIESGIVDADSGKDISIVVEENSATDVGIYLATATGLSGEGSENYVIDNNTARRTFSIDRAQITTPMFEVDTGDQTYAWGDEIEPDVTCLVETMEEGTDYTVSYSDNTDVGEATITITGIGNYEGTLTYHFDIVKIKPDPDSYTVPGPFTATYGDKLESIEGMPTDDASGVGAWDWADDAASTFVGDAGTEYIDAVYTPEDTDHYDTATAQVEVDVAQKSITGMDGWTIVNPTESETYTGLPITKTVVPANDPVTGALMIEGVDYTVIYYAVNSDGSYGPDPVTPVNTGNYIFFIEGIGNYTDYYEDAGYAFTIVPGEPSEIAPTGLTATYGDTLASVVLPRSSGAADSYGWTWDDVDGTDPADYYFHSTGDFSFKASFTNAEGVETVQTDVAVHVNAKPVELVWDEEAHEKKTTTQEGVFDWVYDAVAAKLSATITSDSFAFGGEGEDACTVTEISGDGGVNAGAYVGTAAALSNPYYTLEGATNTSCFYYIEHATATILVDDYTRAYGVPDPDPFTGRTEGFFGEDAGAIGIEYARTDLDEDGCNEHGTHSEVIGATYDEESEAAGNYTITVLPGTLVIDRAELSTGNWEVDTESEVYQGTEIEKEIQAPTDPYTGEPLKAGIDYEVTYFANKDVGTATITITGAGNYSGLLTYTFEITPAPVTISIEDASKVFGAADPDFVYSVEPEEAAAGLGDITCTREPGEDVGPYTISANYTNNPNYSVAVEPGTLRITPRAFDEKVTFWLEQNAFTYTGAGIEPTVYGTDEGTPLVLGTDFTVTYEDNVNVGTATVHISGTGNYSGDVDLTFTIIPATFASDWFDIATSSDIYTGEEIDVSVTPAQGRNLTPYDESTGTGDYSFVIEPPEVVDAGEYTITFTGHGNYEGSLCTRTFTIGKAPLQLAWTSNIKGAEDTFSRAYDATDLEVYASVAEGLVEGDKGLDIGVTVVDGVERDVGVYLATATGLSGQGSENYTLDGSYTNRAFSIEHAPIEDPMFVVDTSDKDYTGEAWTPSVTLTDEEILKPGEGEYSVSYADNIDVGTATITITGSGNFSGKLTYHFEIVQATLEPQYTPQPGQLRATYGDKLESVDLSGYDDAYGNWSWADGDVFVGSANEDHIFSAYYTPKNAEHYGAQEYQLTVTVDPLSIAKMDPTFTHDDAEQQTYTGYNIYADIAVPTDPVTGEALIEGKDYTVTYYDAEGRQIDAPKGVGVYTFEISGQGNYTDTLGRFTVEVIKANPSGELIPMNLYATYGDDLEDVVLPKSDDSVDAWGWYWDDPDEQTDENMDATEHFTATGPHICFAHFVPEDSDDYNNDEHVPLEVFVLPKTVELEWSDAEHYPDATQETGFTRTYDGQASNLVATVQAESLAFATDTCGVEDISGNTEAAAGVHVATANGLDNENYTLNESYSSSCTYYIEHASAVVMPDDASKVYGKGDPELTGTVDGLIGSDTLGDITYTREEGETAGTYTITASVENANPNYQITCETGTFTIEREAFDDSSAEGWTINTDDEIYTGGPITKQIVAPTDPETGVPLVVDVDYTVSYFNNTDVGTATIVITGTGNYSGLIVRTFKITPKAATIACTDASKVYGEADPVLTGEVTGLVNDGELGQISYSRERGEDAGTYEITASYTPNSNYTVTVQVGIFTIEKKKSGEGGGGLSDVTYTLEGDTFTYTGSEICPKVTGHDGDKVLVEGTDYTVAYEDNIDVGTATVIITGCGNYEGETKLTFQIVAEGFADDWFTVDVDGDTYTGTEHAVTVGSAAGHDLTPYDETSGTGDYSFVIYGSDGTEYTGGAVVDADTYTVYITGHNNYDGATAERSFTIAPVPVRLVWESNIEDDPESFSRAYDGTELVVTASVGSGLVEADKSLTLEVEVENNAATDAGAYLASATGLSGQGASNYYIDSSTASRSFSIEHAAVIVGVNNMSKYLGADLPDKEECLAYTYIDNDLAGAITVEDFTITANFTGAEQLGDTYTVTPQISVAEAAAANYEVTIIPGTITVVGHEVPKGITAVYGDKLSDIDLSAYGNWRWDDPDESVGTVLGPNIHTVTYYDDEGNPLDSYEVAVTVQPRSVKLAWSGYETRVYDGTASHVTATITNLVEGDEEVCVVVTGGHETDAGTHTAYAEIKQTDPADLSLNYTLEQDNATCRYVIEHAPLVLEVQNASKTYGEADPAFKVTYDGIVPGESIAYATTVTRTNAGVEDPGYYEGVLVAQYDESAEVARNYAISCEPGDFQINARDITKKMFVVDTSDEAYTGAAITKQISSDLIEGTDYTVSYGHNIAVGTADITITGCGTYAGTLTYHFEIIGDRISAAMFEVDTADKAYTGSAIEPSVKSNLQLGADYTVSYGNNVDVGTALIVITGNGTYSGTLNYNFRIVKESSSTTGKGTDLPIGTTVIVNGGQYTITSTSTARYNWPLKKTVKANVATTITRSGHTYRVTAIDKNAFKNNKKLTVIKIGNYVTSIPNKAFKGCKNVKKIRFGSHVEKIGKQACKGLKKLKKVIFKGKKHLTKIGAKAFKGCKKLKKLKIRSNVLKKKGVKKALKGSKVKTVKTAKKYRKTYKKIFTKKNCGCKVKVK